jgi:NAD-dependent dihydropyrimidine dehydrogenase PreA subunit
LNPSNGSLAGSPVHLQEGLPGRRTYVPAFPKPRPEAGPAFVRLCYYHVEDSVPRRKSEMAFVIAEPCIGVKDATCVQACPVDCIHPKKDEPGFAASDQLYIDPVECIDCAACVPVCPVKAIFVSFDLPKKWASYEEKNAAHFGR